ncbi:Gfo/Idh/MocA family protein [Bryobacter aggregatus]|uniref:Gfo/Idh/MocA family protein n=1 Tax=Bryobacter aggregatus TaxID=360054 RepID=UPI0004E0DA24|nr:Gfo/Idh/MocA family oxidoreductase [Bryobacter aggregatus]
MPETPRRDFLKAAVIAAPAIIRAQTVTNAIKVGLVGAGGRGTGAASQALKADDYAELAAVGDVSIDQINGSLERVKKINGEKVKVVDGKKYIGFDAYQHVIDSDIDVVLLATPPGFRPGHLRYAVEKKKHIFTEKPMAVDPTGVRSVIESVRMAKENNKSLVDGFMWRYSNYINATFEQLHSGIIGDIVSYYATYYTGPVKPMPAAATRPAGMSDVEWQTKNWYNFVWTSGDGYVEQAVHSVDKVAWAFKDQPPVSCVAHGGRQIPQDGGNIFDHIEVNYLYPNGARAFVAHRQIPGIYNENADYILGTKGKITIGRSPFPKVEDHQGNILWKFDGQKNDGYQYEHDLLFASIRKGQPINKGDRMISSTLLAIMGRTAAYTGAELTWEQIQNSKLSTFPEPFDPKGSLPDSAPPKPGITKFV